jgi:hypothetical protein
MIVDQELRVNNGESVRASDPDYSSAIDLTISPIVGTGTELYAVIVVDTYTQGSSGGTTFKVVTSSASDFSANRRVLGTQFVSNTDLELRDDDANRQAIVVKINPDHDRDPDTASGIPVSGTTGRYLGIQYDHDTAAPTVMTVTAYFVTEFQADPAAGFHASGSTIL